MVINSSDFNITTEHFTFEDAEMQIHQALKISMTRNGRTFNIVNHLMCFQDGASCLSTLEASMRELVKNLYPECFSKRTALKRKIQETEIQLDGLKKHLIAMEEHENDKTNKV